MAEPWAVEVSIAEMRVARAFIADGASNQMIANRLKVSEDTVKTHIKRLLAKTNQPQRSSLIAAIWSGRVDLRSKTCPSLRDWLKRIFDAEKFIIP